MVPAQAIPFPTLIIALCASVVGICALIIHNLPITKLTALRLGRQGLLCFATVAFSSAALVLRFVQSTTSRWYNICFILTLISVTASESERRNFGSEGIELWYSIIFPSACILRTLCILGCERPSDLPSFLAILLPILVEYTFGCIAHRELLRWNFINYGVVILSILTSVIVGVSVPSSRFLLLGVDLSICSFFNIRFDIWYDYTKGKDIHDTIPSSESPSARNLVDTQMNGGERISTDQSRLDTGDTDSSSVAKLEGAISLHRTAPLVPLTVT